ncbi:MAG: Na/Pi cotransporter family protein [Lachnospiraceae bacterium]|jgi:phosphate:Na+ symporter|uniref:Na/Pi cotransporter family protein n=1 Tax=Candidatus Merdisoma sp. JLR.KK006 TaxID=3112626 RepID=UPI002FF1C9E3|nr:Na/Pi cotransporter family protein [Lachnospiraceae bacterium]
MQHIEMLFRFIGGLGMFLYGMNVMADGLQKSAGGRMRHLLEVLTKNRLMGILLGAAVTAVIQSSSATTVMVVGFVNAGLMNLTQAAGIIMGANIGTTITAWVVSMSEWGSALKPEFFAPLLIGIGAFLILFSKKEKARELSEILMGFGILFIGLSFMSGAITPYRDAPIFSEAFRILGGNPILGILTGLAVTAVIQSSSASVGILQTLAANGVVTWNSAIYITLGQNIGTCVTALLSSLGAQRTAKRAAAIHLLFNVIGAVIFGGIMFSIFTLNRTLAASSISSVQISVFHTVFNITNTLILFPFANWLVKMSGLLVKGEEETEEEKEEEYGLPHLDERILETPSFAVEHAAKEVVRMGELSCQHAKLVFDAVRTGNQKRVDKAYQIEETMNKYESRMTEYLAKISTTSLTDHQRQVVGNLVYTVSDIERMSDHCDNIAEMAERMIQERLTFSMEAMEGLEELEGLALDSMKASILARQTEKIAYVQQTIQLEDEVDDLEEELREKHIERLSRNQCSAARGVIYLDILSNIERISDHANNIAGYVADEI